MRRGGLRKRYGRKWIQAAHVHKGALHRALGIPEGEPIPLAKLQWAARQPGKLGRQARFALNLRGVRSA